MTCLGRLIEGAAREIGGPPTLGRTRLCVLVEKRRRDLPVAFSDCHLNRWAHAESRQRGSFIEQIGGARTETCHRVVAVG
jgi:hypothetical protein